MTATTNGKVQEGAPGLGKRRFYKSPSKLRRDCRRLRAFVDKRGLGKCREGPAKLSGYASILDSVLQCSMLPAAKSYRGVDRLHERRYRRHRDLFPLPLFNIDVTVDGDVTTVANACLVGLNCLYSDCKTSKEAAHRLTKPTVAQAAVLHHIWNRSLRFLGRLKSDTGSPWNIAGVFARFDKGESPGHVTLDPDKVDMPQRAGNFDTVEALPAEVVRRFDSAGLVFPNGGPLSSTPCQYAPEARNAYARLTARGLLSGKLRLRHVVKGWGGEFCVGKQNSDRLRAVWNGTMVSQCAEDPPAPRRLANPSVFVDLEIDSMRGGWFSRRDASSFFDQLRAPTWLTAYFGRPSLTVKELADNMEVTAEDLREFIDDDQGSALSDDQLLTPIGCTWQMGFSWSSFVAQETSILIALRSGLRVEQLLCPDQPLPSDFNEVATVATDDIILIHQDENVGAARLKQLDEAFDRSGIVCNESKDINLERNMTALGCDLSSHPPVAEPSLSKISNFLQLCLDLVTGESSSPRGFAALLGIAQWFSLLSRPHYSIFDTCYEFMRREPQSEQQLVPHPALNEVLIFVMLAPLLPASMDRQWCPLVAACDAAPSFGFGVSVSPISSWRAGQLGRLSERRGDYVRITRDCNEAPERDRLGRPHQLGLQKSDFTDIISCRAKNTSHASRMEAQAFVLMTKWLVRSATRFHHRCLVLCDSKAVIGAVTKGRSSSTLLRHPVRQVAALCLASNMLLRVVYIPSEDNAADGPSRGRRRRTKHAPRVKGVRSTLRLLKEVERHRWLEARLRKEGIISDHDDDDDSFDSY